MMLIQRSVTVLVIMLFSILSISANADRGYHRNYNAHGTYHRGYVHGKYYWNGRYYNYYNNGRYYNNCKMVAGHWVNGTWLPAARNCW